MAQKAVIAELLVEIGVDAKDAEKAAARIGKKLKAVGTAGRKAGKGVDKAERSLKRYRAAAVGAAKFSSLLSRGLLAATAALVGMGTAILKTAGNFEIMRARLNTATGSAEATTKVFNEILAFARTVPFGIGEITDSFIRLKNLGLDPNTDTLLAFSNVAAATGFTIKQFAEAVADATTFEFERLKEFGIRARQESDSISFIFRGNTRSVGKNAKEVNDFLVGIGLEEFAGAAAGQMNTLTGLVSNLKDTFLLLFEEIAQAGPLQEMKLLLDDIAKAAGGQQGLAQVIADTLVQAIKALRRLVAGDFSNTLKNLIKLLGLVAENFGKLIALLAAAKTLQAFQAITAAMTAMGFAASASLGPIGLIAAALVALLPVAKDVGEALGNVFGRRKGVSRVRRGRVRTFGAEFGESTPQVQRGAQAALSEFKSQEARLREIRKAGGNRVAELTVQRSRDAARAELDRFRKIAFEDRSRVARLQKQQENQRALEEKTRDKAAKAERAEFGEFDQSLAQIRKDLGLEEGDVPKSARTRKRLDAAIEVLALGGKTKDARKAAGLDKFGRPVAPKKKKKKKVTSITTVSELFQAVARGDVKNLAASTPSTKDIEPTVAVDITNNNFNFNIKQDITGQIDAKEAGSEAAKQIKMEFKVRLAAAGQQLQGNLAR